MNELFKPIANPEPGTIFNDRFEYGYFMVPCIPYENSGDVLEMFMMGNEL